MRPINRGAPPKTAITEYRDAFDPLITNIGRYCSYCERRIETHLAIEHVQSKSCVPHLKLKWENFLLACVNCNSCKGDKSICLDDFVWPDTNNTMLAFSYSLGDVRNALEKSHLAYSKVQSLIRLVGLDKNPGHPEVCRRPTRSDNRWKYRMEVLEIAKISRMRLERNNSDELREQIVENAKSHGGFSIWFEVFKDDSDMKKRLVSSFEGTNENCFDKYYSPIPLLGVPI